LHRVGHEVIYSKVLSCGTGGCRWLNVLSSRLKDDRDDVTERESKHAKRSGRNYLASGKS
jgi:hypothetical protein